MKKYFILTVLIMVIFPTIILAQENPIIEIDSSNTGKSFSENMTEMIEPLDKSQITTGILSDKAFILSSMNEFNGQNDSMITLSRWKQIYRQLYNASISLGTIFSPDSAKSIAENYLNQDIIPLAILYVKYNEFKSYALDSNLVQFINGKLYDVQGRNQSPYNEKRLFAAALLKDKIYHGQVNFRMDDNFLISNITDTISSIEIDFGDGQGFINISGNNYKRDSTISVQYFDTGTKTLIAKITLSNNTVLSTKSNFTIVSTSSISPDASFSVSGYLPYNGSTGAGTAYVLYGCGNNNQLRKPIIVSDGFDPTNERHFNELYDLLNRENFIEKARAEGFDFVILDYHSGGDYIQRNAYVLISTINNVNSQLTANGSTSQLIVVGPSMAGLISRYALYYMEQNNLKHNTRLYISFDSPHLGASIPLGDQYWLDFFAKYASAQGAIDGRAQLNTPAAQQMLVYHFSSFPYTNSLRTAFINDTYFHFPSKCRKIAIANGSGNNSSFFNPCNQIISYVYHVNILGDVVKGNAWAVPSPSNGQCQIFEGKIPTQFLFGVPIGYTKQTIKVSNTKPFDSAPGGSTDVNKTIADGDTQGKGDIITDYPDECFIPTVSALAINTTDLNFNLLGLINYPYPQPGETPFDAIFAPTSNQEHVLITAENIAWIMNEASQLDLYLQNQTINDNGNFEARNTITIGKNVDPIPNRQQTGDFITEPGSVVNIHSGQLIVVKDGTWFKAGNNAHLFIDPFPCSAVFKLVNKYGNNNNQNNSITEEKNTIKENTQRNSFIQNYPNPCKDNTHIEYSVKETACVEISLYNIYGQQMEVLEDNYNQQTGSYVTTLDATKISAGTYICLLKTNGIVTGTLKILVVK